MDLSFSADRDERQRTHRTDVERCGTVGVSVQITDTDKKRQREVSKELAPLRRRLGLEDTPEKD